jgi:hypothetical protein
VKTLYFDCFSGAAGDMILGALIDAGTSMADLRAALGRLAIEPDAVWTERVVRAGLTATKLHVRGEAGAHQGQGHHQHHHHHHDLPHRQQPVESHDHAGVQTDQPATDLAHAGGAGGSQRHVPDRSRHPAPEAHAHRTLADIHRLIDGSCLSLAGKERAKGLFDELGRVEAAIHGTTLDRVHLHEVGALDSIVDIVGAVWALEALGVRHVASSPLNVGGGTVRSAHGVYPVPAPATLRLLEGVPIYAGRSDAELVTPTGALLIRAYATEFGGVPPMRVTATGYGAGSRDFPDAPNVLRVIVGDAEAKAARRSVVVIEAEIDDMNPQLFGVLMDRLTEHGALDVFYTPVQMKKNRPGTLLTVVAPPEDRARLVGVIFRETTTIGVRYRDMHRECLDRETVLVTTAFGPVRMKVARLDGEALNASPEFADCVELARRHGRPVKEIQALASKAFLDRA